MMLIGIDVTLSFLSDAMGCWVVSLKLCHFELQTCQRFATDDCCNAHGDLHLKSSLDKPAAQSWSRAPLHPQLCLQN